MRQTDDPETMAGGCLLATALSLMLLGCIPTYDDFVGAKDPAEQDRVVEGRGTEEYDSDEFALNVCTPDCAGKSCGEDGCGGSCGLCPAGSSCQADQCKVVCGDDQCGDGEDKCNCPSDCSGGCTGCCQGTVCKAGNLNSGCGKNGAACVACGGGKTCESQACVAITWKDSTSGLTWQITPTGGGMNWSVAKAHCSGLSLDGGGWDLPTIGELRTLIRGCPATEAGGSCNVKEGDCLTWFCWDDSCSGCSGYDGPGEGGMYWPDEIEGDCCWYWSSSPVEDYADSAWLVLFSHGYVDGSGVSYGAVHVRCVR